MDSKLGGNKTWLGGGDGDDPTGTDRLGSGASKRVCAYAHITMDPELQSLSLSCRHRKREREREIKFAALVAGWWCLLLVKHRAMSCYSNIKARHKGGGCMRMREHSLCQCLPAAAAERGMCVYLGSSKFVIGRKCVCHQHVRARTDSRN